MTTQELEYLIKVNDRDLAELKGRVRDVNKTIGDDTTHHAGRASSALGGLGKTAGLVAFGLAGAGVASLAGAAKVGFDEFREGERVSKQTETVLKSTGGAAGVTAGHISNLAGELLNKSGVDDEAIQSGENLLLTFTNIRNEAGKGNDVFDQTTKTMLDMSVALGQDTKTSAIQLGKALNDPVKGVSALQRVGVSFTESQKEQIKTLVESGNTMGAQKLILAELGKEFGGSAKAAGDTFDGSLNKLKETFNNLAGSAVGAVIPALSGVLSKVTDNLPAISAFAGGLVDKAKPALAAVAGTIREVVIPIVIKVEEIWRTAITKIGAVLEAHRPELENIWRNVTKLLTGVGAVLEATVIPILRFALTKVLPEAIAIALPILSKLFSAVGIIGDVFRVLASVIDKARGALGELGAWVGKQWGKIGGLLSAPIDAARGVFSGFASIVERVASVLERVIDLAGKASGVVGKVGGILGHIPGFASGVQNFSGGLAMVGENGPELVVLPQGSSVIPNERVAGLTSSSSSSRFGFAGGGSVIELHVHAESVIGSSLEDAARELAQPILAELRRYQLNGGSLAPA